MKTAVTIIPQQNYGLIVEISDEQDITVISKIEIPYNTISKIVDNKTVVTLDKNNQQLLLHNINGSFIESIDVPFGLAMNVKGNIVYIGGNAREGEVCYMLDLSVKEHSLTNINLPVPMAWGKAVDDILILGNKMLLIDNIVYPKYTFEYDISVPNKPVWVETIELPHHRAYENIIKGDINENWMIYLSTSSSGWTGDEAHITIEGKYNNIISSSKKESILDICLVNDKLYVLTDIGLGYFDLNKAEIELDDIIFIEHQNVADRIIKIDDRKLLLVSPYDYELLDLNNLQYTGESIEERFWSYGSLDLSDRDLEEFPLDKIRHLERVEHLDLSNNKIEILPEVLRKCKKLRSLNLKLSGIKKIPEWIEAFESLEYLNLSTINIDSPIPFMSSRIKLPKNLRMLNLRYCKISAIPPSVFELKDLEYLNLLENSISRIPQEMIDLKKLKTLKIRWENVSKFPDNIKDLPLETVEISADNRGEIPEVIYSMTNLKRIEAKGAGIEKVSDKLVNFSKLEYLDLRDNYDLKVLPQSIGGLKKLRILGLSVCGLKELPESFCELTELEVLHLQHNELTMLPVNIGKLTKLRKLDLEANQLTELPESFKQLTSLKSLLLSGNKLTTLPKGIGKFKKVTQVELSENRFIDFPNELCDLVQLKTLDIRNNSIEVIPSEIHNLKNLTQLNMANNHLNTLPNDIGKLKSLVELRLSNNKIETLPSSIGNLTQLRELDLSGNLLRELPETLFTLSSLETLSIEDNKLEALPEEIGNLTQLKKLEIKGNAFTTLPESITKLTNLEGLSLPDYIFELTEKQKAWLKSLYEKQNSIGYRLPFPPSSYMSVSDRLLSETNMTEVVTVSDEVLDKLIAWANSNQLKELTWREPWSEGDDGSWDGFPRDKELLVRLQKLNLLGAKCDTLPQEIGYLTQLKKLNLCENSLTRLPKSIGSLTNLTELRLCRNKLKKLPVEIGNLTGLRYLSLANNEMDSLPDTFGHLYDLEYLELCQNNLKKLPDSIVNLTNLTYLDLNNNKNLKLTSEQKKWVAQLEANDCRIWIS